jgi:predicted phosphate transport protein (TIGR00153 family)
MRRRKHYNYFNKFVELVDYSCKCAEILYDTIINFDPNTLSQKVDEIHRIEHSGDLAKHEITARLATEFIAPIEREDIVTLSQQIDDITDAIEDVLIKIHIFNVSSLKPEVLEFSQLIIKLCKTLKVALKEFANFRKSTILQEKIVEVNNLEEVGDKLYYNAVHNLYLNSKDPVELLVWTEIFNHLEKCCDACEMTADTVESIVMKNS